MSVKETKTYTLYCDCGKFIVITDFNKDVTKTG